MVLVVLVLVVLVVLVVVLLVVLVVLVVLEAVAPNESARNRIRTTTASLTTCRISLMKSGL